MPTRKDIFRNGGYYHLFNKTIDQRLIFQNEDVCQRFIELMRYYRSTKSHIRFSHFANLDSDMQRSLLIKILTDKFFKVDILCYCLMPNHFHILVKQKKDKGIIRFISDIVNSLTRYFNLIHERKGPIFLPQFQSRAVNSREQLVHVSRYIHLNPFSSGIIENANLLVNYPHSSFQEYAKRKPMLCNHRLLLDEFKNNYHKYQEFVLSNANLQKTLGQIKYAEKWF